MMRWAIHYLPLFLFPYDAFATILARHLDSTTAAEPPQICAYPMSGQYGPTSRYVYYSLIFTSIILHKVEWLVSGTLAASMLFSSVAAIHGIALASVRSYVVDIVDLDIIPVITITVVGMLCAPTVAHISKTLQKVATSVRVILSAWVLLMIAGLIASFISIVGVIRSGCNGISVSDGCVSQCNGTLQMRVGHPVLMPSPWPSGGHLILLLLSALYGLPLALTYVPGHALVVAALQAQRGTWVIPRLSSPKEVNAKLKRYFLRIFSSLLNALICIFFIVTHIVTSEMMMMVPPGLPLGESLFTFGQWAPLIGAILALCGSLVKWIWGNSSSDTCEGVDRDLESLRHKDFKEGAWWGRRAEGTIMACGGKKWIVRDGILRREDDVLPVHEDPGSNTPIDEIPLENTAL